MLWYKQFSDEDESLFIGDLLERIKLKGYYFWNRLKKLMAKYFDVYEPGCNKFNIKWFQQQFPEIKDMRSIFVYLNFLQDTEKAFYWTEGRQIILYWPNLENLADEYTRKVLADQVRRDNAESAEEIIDNEMKLPTFLHDRCMAHAKKIALEHAENAKNMLENKEDMPKSIGTNSELDVGTSSTSSSRAVNNLNKKGDKSKKPSTLPPY